MRCHFISVVISLWLSSVAALDYCGPPARRTKPFILRGNLQLQQVVVVIRHGDRTHAWPKQCWPNDTTVWDCNLSSGSRPVVNKDSHQIVVDRIYRKVYIKNRELQKGDCGIGQLTKTGYEQEMANGEILRKAYVLSGFLSKQFSPTEVFLRSDDEPRTIQSAQAVALGLYPPIPSPSSKVEVLNINTRDKVIDDLEPNAVVCPMFQRLVNDCLRSDAYVKHYNEVTKALLRDLELALNSPGLTASDIIRLLDCMLVRKCHNKPLPPKVNDALFQRTFTEGLWQTEFKFRCPSQVAIAKVGIGFLIGDIWKILNDSIQEKSTRKFTLISGHDTTLTALLNALNVSDGVWPRYASMLQFELYSTTSAVKRNARFAIRVVYNGKEVKLPFCDDILCDISQFSAYINTVISKDPVADCKVNNHGKKWWFL